MGEQQRECALSRGMRSAISLDDRCLQLDGARAERYALPNSLLVFAQGYEQQQLPSGSSVPTALGNETAAY